MSSMILGNVSRSVSLILSMALVIGFSSDVYAVGASFCVFVQVSAVAYVGGTL